MNYPPGAKYDPRAPYNELNKYVPVCVSVTYHKTIEVEVLGPYDEQTLYELASYELENELIPLENNGWIQDEMEVIEDE